VRSLVVVEVHPRQRERVHARVPRKARMAGRRVIAAMTAISTTIAAVYPSVRTSGIPARVRDSSLERDRIRPVGLRGEALGQNVSRVLAVRAREHEVVARLLPRSPGRDKARWVAANVL
jgi:hypothetical protein